MPNKPNPTMNEELDALLGIIFVACIVSVVMSVAFLLTIQQILKKCRLYNREIEPAMIWLILVPFFGLFWFIIVVNKVALSLRNEFRERGLKGSGFGRTAGLMLAVNSLISSVAFTSMNVWRGLHPEDQLVVERLAFSLGFGVVILAAWIAYWIQLAGYNRQLNRKPIQDDYY